jgi:hypothetical protein
VPPPLDPGSCARGVTAGIGRWRSPRVTIVQRQGTRSTGNLEELILAVNATLGSVPRVVDTGRLSLVEQARAFHSSDVVILVHGAALVDALWLPFGAVVVDVYPYHMPVSFAGGLVHWLRAALSPLELLHEPFEIIDPGDQIQVTARNATTDGIAEKHWGRRLLPVRGSLIKRLPGYEWISRDGLKVIASF